MTVAVPKVMTDPGVLYIASIGSTPPVNTVAAGVFSDTWAAATAWLPLGATSEGSTFSYSTTVEPIRAAEFFDPIKYATTDRGGNIAFSLMDYTLQNYRRALNGGVGALTPTSGSGATALYHLSPTTPGNEVRCMIAWESLDHTMRLFCNQTIQGGEVTSAFAKAPAVSVIPCTFNMEVPPTGEVFDFWSTRG